MQTPAIDLLNIPDLTTDDDIVAVVDELKHRLRSGAPLRGKWSKIRSSLDGALRSFIDENGLGWDQHSHAKMPPGESP